MKKTKTEMEKLISGLANVRRRSGNMQALATQEVYYLRKIVVLLQLQQRYRLDTINIQARKIRRLQRLNDLHRAALDACYAEIEQLKADKVRELSAALSQINSPQNLVPSHVPGLDL